jgi:hypothetical protein
LRRLALQEYLALQQHPHPLDRQHRHRPCPRRLEQEERIISMHIQTTGSNSMLQLSTNTVGLHGNCMTEESSTYGCATISWLGIRLVTGGRFLCSLLGSGLLGLGSLTLLSLSLLSRLSLRLLFRLCLVGLL